MELTEENIKAIIWVALIIFAFILVKKVFNLIKAGAYKIATLYITLITGSSTLSAYNLAELFTQGN